MSFSFPPCMYVCLSLAISINLFFTLTLSFFPALSYSTCSLSLTHSFNAFSNSHVSFSFYSPCLYVFSLSLYQLISLSLSFTPFLILFTFFFSLSCCNFLYFIKIFYSSCFLFYALSYPSLLSLSGYLSLFVCVCVFLSAILSLSLSLSLAI